MSSIFAMTEDAKRRAEGVSRRYSGAEIKIKPIITEDIKELLILIVVLALLYRAGANPLLLLAIMYVTI